MDSPSHALWTYALEKSLWPEYLKDNPFFLFSSLFFSVLPDLVVDIPLVVYLIFKKSRFDLKNLKQIIIFAYDIVRNRPEDYQKLFPWSFKTAFYSHSFLVCLICVLILNFAYPKALLPFVFGYGMHLLVDLPLHNDHFASKPLYPLSNFTIAGWLTWYKTKNFQKYNYFLLLAVYLTLFLYGS